MKDISFISILADRTTDFTIHHLGQETEGLMKTLQMFIKLLYSDDTGGLLKLMYRGSDSDNVPVVKESNLGKVKQYINMGISLSADEVKRIQANNIALYGEDYYSDLELYDSCIIKSLDIDEVNSELNLGLEFRTVGGSTEVNL